MSDRTKKLIALRNRTDLDLLVLVNPELDRGIVGVDMATTRNSPVFAQAEKSYSAAKTLLPWIAGLTQDDRLRMESKLDELRGLLDQVPVYANLPTYPASFAS